MFYICMFCDAFEFTFITSSIASIIRFKQSCFILCIDVKSCLLRFDISKIFFKRKVCCKIQHILGMNGLLSVRINNLYSKIESWHELSSYLVKFQMHKGWLHLRTFKNCDKVNVKNGHISFNRRNLISNVYTAILCNHINIRFLFTKNEVFFISKGHWIFFKLYRIMRTSTYYWVNT